MLFVNMLFHQQYVSQIRDSNISAGFWFFPRYILYRKFKKINLQ